MRKGEIQILAEDVQHRAFLRRMLKKMGFNGPQIHEAKVPAKATLGRTFVLNQIASELKIHRSRFHSVRSRRLVVMIDADDNTVDETIQQLRGRVEAAGELPHETREGVVIFVPRREIENWLEYLGGNNVTEEHHCPKRKGREREIAELITRFEELCHAADHGQSGRPLLPSLQAGFREVHNELLVDLASE